MVITYECHEKHWSHYLAAVRPEGDHRPADRYILEMKTLIMSRASLTPVG